jgi:hypothetical protein
MTQPAYSPDTKKLLMQYLLEDIEYRKECRYMQELVHISKQDDTMQATLAIFIDDAAVHHFSLTGLTHN